jgi:signal transduction histidine kinase
VASAACAVFVILGALVYRAVERSTALQFDQMLKRQGAIALTYADHEYGEGESVVPDTVAELLQPQPFDSVFQITTRQHRVLYRSRGAPQALLAPADSLGFANMLHEGRWWRVYTLRSQITPLVIHMAGPLEYRDALLSQMLRAVALPLVFALALLTALVALVTELAFRPVRRMAEDLAGRGADDLSPVNTAEMPVETQALGIALNGLLARHAEVLSRERRFTADAAHELRTPLAALRAQAQVAARAASDGERRRALDKLQVSIDRTAHLISQLLALARLEPGSDLGTGQVMHPRAVVDLVVEGLAQAARDKRVSIAVLGGVDHLIGSSEALYLLVRNLLENSIRNVGQGGHVALEVKQVADTVVLTVSDDGPGIPSEERARAFQRFYRVPGGASGGSGLGLSIVARVVQLLGGSIELAAPPSGTGLLVTVRLPAQPAEGGPSAILAEPQRADRDTA